MSGNLESAIGIESKAYSAFDIELIKDVAEMVSDHSDIQPQDSYKDLIMNHLSFTEKMVYFTMRFYEKMTHTEGRPNTDRYLREKVHEKRLAPKIIDQLAENVEHYMQKKENKIIKLEQDLKKWETLQEHYDLNVESLSDNVSTCLKDLVSMRKEKSKYLGGRLLYNSPLMRNAKALSQSMSGSLEKYGLIERNVCETKEILDMQRSHYIQARKIYEELKGMAGRFKAE